MDSLSVDPDAGLPVTLAARLLNVTPAAVKGWARRKLIEPVRTDPQHGRLYRWRDLQTAELATADSPNRRSLRLRDAIEAEA